MLLALHADIALSAVFGLLIGSFLNVVIHRLPKMLERQWAAECAALQERHADAAPTYNLMRPRSACPHCGHVLPWYENIPVASWLALRGRCASCKAPIGVRYPAVEVATSALFAYAAWRWGVTPAGAAWAAFGATLLALALIDWDTTLLPDDLTLPLVWAGLIAATLAWTQAPLADALWGAVAGYLSLWTIYQGFRLLTGKEGMGFGDFKLLAALGAWFGWQALIPIILIASVLGAVVGIALKFTRGLREGGYLPFGPFLAFAGLAAMVAGPARLLQVLGLAL